MIGRPLSLDEVKAQRIFQALEAGNTRKCAAALAGVAKATLQNWIKAARAGDPRFTAFLDRLEKADAEAENGAVQAVRAGAQGWQGAAWWLERRRRQSWRRPAVPAPERDERDLSSVDDAELYAAVERIKGKVKSA